MVIYDTNMHVYIFMYARTLSTVLGHVLNNVSFNRKRELFRRIVFEFDRLLPLRQVGQWCAGIYWEGRTGYAISCFEQRVVGRATLKYIDALRVGFVNIPNDSLPILLSHPPLSPRPPSSQTRFYTFSYAMPFLSLSLFFFFWMESNRMPD